MRTIGVAGSIGPRPRGDPSGGAVVVTQRLGDDGGGGLQDQLAQCGGRPARTGTPRSRASWVRVLTCSGWPTRRPGNSQANTWSSGRSSGSPAPCAARPCPGRSCAPAQSLTRTVVTSDAGLSHLMRAGQTRSSTTAATDGDRDRVVFVTLRPRRLPSDKNTRWRAATATTPAARTQAVAYSHPMKFAALC